MSGCGDSDGGGDVVYHNGYSVLSIHTIAGVLCQESVIHYSMGYLTIACDIGTLFFLFYFIFFYLPSFRRKQRGTNF